jgi:hypothetical protein
VAGDWVMTSPSPELQAHREWLGQIQQVGLVVSPQVLVNRGIFVDRQKSVEVQTHLRELCGGEEDAAIADFAVFTRAALEWSHDAIVSDGLPNTLTIALPEYQDVLSPTAAMRSVDSPGEWTALVQVVPAGTDLDKLPAEHIGWRVTPHARLERLLRETSVPVGLLFNGTSLRLVYAPRGESSGHLTFRFAHLTQTLGRPMAGALYALLGPGRLDGNSLPGQDLPALLRESRKYQNEVSTALAGQVLEALWELLRGLQRANADAKGQLLAEVLREQPGEVYGGLLSTLMRLVFVLYAEDRGLMPQSEVYQRHYSVAGLFERLREDHARHPDTMDARYGAWAQLLVLFRLIHDGGGHGSLRFPPRHGRLFDPDAYPFLEGRPHRSNRQAEELLNAPKIADGVVYRVLRNLLILDGERLSYRALDVEQIGSVYEAMMGFSLQQAGGPSIGVSPKHIVFDIRKLLERNGKDRAGWLKEQTELKVTGDALAKASSSEDVVGALGKKVSRYTPQVLKAGDLFLQPTEERRRSGSHYTPRSLTEPIVRTTFRPIFERLGERATPEQILDLKVCDPAMGSGAFLVEACRLLGERLVRAWELQKSTPPVPEDEDVWTYARRLVAERCLYGVDKNIFAVDLAKLSLWLVTLARDHPFTFLNHSLRHGDSLVGLSREQIACLHWAPTKQLPLIRGFLDARVGEAQKLRVQIGSMGASDDVPQKARLLRAAEEEIGDVRLIADIVVSAFFAREKAKARETLRIAYTGQIEKGLSDTNARTLDDAVRRQFEQVQESLRYSGRAVPAFHWEIEFPEVFTRGDGGFDAFVGNPPFMGGSKISSALGAAYLSWVLKLHPGSHGNGDLVAHFFRRAFSLARRHGTLGLIATNTISQGDTRTTGLTAIRHSGGTIYAAIRRVVWPARAAVVVSVVYVLKGDNEIQPLLDGKPVERITAFLIHRGGDDVPSRLKANTDIAFLGSKIYGQGFTFDDTDKDGVANPLSLMYELIRKNPRNAERIFPYIGGEEINESPTQAHHRFVINFEQMSEEEARRWPDLMAIVEKKVKPERLKQKRAVRARYWWRFGEVAPALYAAIRGLDAVLVNSQVGNRLSFAFQPTNRVFSHAVNVFVLPHHFQFAVLQSRPHEYWARVLGSSMKDDLRYTPSDCFDTFPFPAGYELDAFLERAGREYYEFRAAHMVRTNVGLTTTYNRFHDCYEDDPDIVKLRELHDLLDRAVLDAYGWTDIRPTCEFLLDYVAEERDTPGKASKRKKPWRYRWPDDIRDEVLGRLLELNATRAKNEEMAGGVSQKRSSRKTRKTVATPSSTGSLLD